MWKWMGNFIWFNKLIMEIKEVKINWEKYLKIKNYNIKYEYNYKNKPIRISPILYFQVWEYSYLKLK